MARNQLQTMQPFLRYGPHSCAHYNYAANHGASGVAVTQPTYCCPQRFLVVVRMTGGAPQGKGNCVLRCDLGTVPQSRGHSLRRSALRKIDGVLNPSANLTW